MSTSRTPPCSPTSGGRARCTHSWSTARRSGYRVLEDRAVIERRLARIGADLDLLAAPRISGPVRTVATQIPALRAPGAGQSARRAHRRPARTRPGPAGRGRPARHRAVEPAARPGRAADLGHPVDHHRAGRTGRDAGARQRRARGRRTGRPRRPGRGDRRRRAPSRRAGPARRGRHRRGGAGQHPARRIVARRRTRPSRRGEPDVLRRAAGRRPAVRLRHRAEPGAAGPRGAVQL